MLYRTRLLLVGVVFTSMSAAVAHANISGYAAGSHTAIEMMGEDTLAHSVRHTQKHIDDVNKAREKRKAERDRRRQERAQRRKERRLRGGGSF